MKAFRAITGVCCLLLGSIAAISNACQWEESWVTLFDESNGAFTPTTFTYEEEIGTTTSSDRTRGGSSSNTQSQDSESSSGTSYGGGANIGIGAFGISGSASKTSGSSSRSGTSSTNEHNWSETDTTSANTMKKSSHTVTCEPQFRCVKLQLVGRCGNRETRISKYNNTRIPLKSPTIKPSEQVTLKPLTIERTGEVWIHARNVTFKGEPSDTWERPETCAPSSFVNAFRFKVGPRGSGMSLLALNCSKRAADTDFQSMKEMQSGFPSSASPWIEPFRNSHPNEYANGFLYQTWTGRNGKVFRGNWKLTFNEQPDWLFLPNGAREVTTTRVKCDNNQAVCGLMTALDSRTKSVITNVGLKCCYYCIPTQQLVTKHKMTNLTPNDIDGSKRLTVGTRKETSTSTGKTQSNDDSTSTQGINLSGIQAGFAATFGSSSSTGFNWGSTEQAVWNSDKEESFSWKCPPNHKCVIQQLEGSCGEFKIFTTHQVIKATPLESEKPIENIVDEGSYEAE